MSKIVQAVNVMVLNPDKISDVIPGYTESEIFFVYDVKHKWSILMGAGDAYYLHFYPGDQDLKAIADMDEEEWDRKTHRVSYNTRDLAAKEAFDSFKELYNVVKSKAYGMDDVLDEIIMGDLI